MPASSYTQKLLRVTFTLTNGAVFEGGGGGNQLVLSGLRIVACVEGAGFPAWPDCDIAIYGMKQADMNTLSSLAVNLEQVNRNEVLLEANSGSGWGAVFSGDIVNAWVDYSGAPEVCLRLHGRVLYLASLTATPAVSYPGPTDVVQILTNLASKVGYALENNGVSVQLSNPYCAGTVGDQIRQICEAANITPYFNNNTLSICPKGQARDGVPFMLTPQSGLVGYPVAESRGYLQTRALYHPAYHQGGKVTIQGSQTVIDANQNPAVYNLRADGQWYIGTIRHTLESVKFGGAWFTDMLLQPLGTQQVAS
jgi:hypothetical protein